MYFLGNVQKVSVWCTSDKKWYILVPFISESETSWKSSNQCLIITKIPNFRAPKNTVYLIINDVHWTEKVLHHLWTLFFTDGVKVKGHSLTEASFACKLRETKESEDVVRDTEVYNAPFGCWREPPWRWRSSPRTCLTLVIWYTDISCWSWLHVLAVRSLLYTFQLCGRMSQTPNVSWSEFIISGGSRRPYLWGTNVSNSYCIIYKLHCYKHTQLRKS